MTAPEPRRATHEEAFRAASEVSSCYGVEAAARQDERFGWVVTVRATPHHLLPAAWSGVLVHRETES